MLYGCPPLKAGTRTLALETSWDMPSLALDATVNIDVIVLDASRVDFADPSLDTSSIAVVPDRNVRSSNGARVTARNVRASNVDPVPTPLAVLVAKKRLT